MFSADLHIHTIASTHAYSTVNEYAAIANSRGIHLLAITDHGPAMPDAPPLWHLMNMRVLPRILEGVAVLRGVEANILETGLDCPDDVLDDLDIVLAGLHSPCQPPLGRQDNTAMMVNAITSGKVHIVTHPGNPVFAIDADAVAEAATRHNVALEVNNSSFLYTRKNSREACLRLIAAQRDAGGWVAAGSDAHHSHALGTFEESLKILREVNFPEERIVNANPERVLNFLRQYHGKRIAGLESLFPLV